MKDLYALIPDHEHKPKSERGLRSALVRLAPALRLAGINITYEQGHTNTVRLSRWQSAQLPLTVDDTHFAEADPDDVPPF